MSAKIGVVIAALLAGAWGFLMIQAWQMRHLPMTEMWMAPAGSIAWRLLDFAWVFGMWAVMMAAMMLPTALPMLNIFARYCQRDPGSSELKTFGFIAGYLAVWMLFSLGATVLQWLFHTWAWLSPMMDNHQPLLATAIFFLAGLYQFTVYKNACLHHCRTPIGYLLSHWRPGMRGAVQIGFRHGWSCLGCCWAQMLIMFAVGVMNVLGMLLVTLLVIIEKYAPVDANRLSGGIGVLFLLAGFYNLWQATV